MDEDLNKLLAQWLVASDEGNAKNKLGEKIAELCAHAKLEAMYGKDLKAALVIPRRGEEGVVILDIVYELHNGDVVIAESKFNMSKRGKLKQTIYAVDDEVGAAEVWNVEGGITQLEGRWVKDRITEIEKQDAKLARKLETSWGNLKLKVVEIRTVPEVTNGKAVIKDLQVIDETETINNFKRGVPVQRTPQQKASRNVAKKLAAENSPAEHAERIAKDAREKANKASKEAQKLRDKASKAQKDAKDAVKAETKKKRTQIAKDADDAAKKAEAEAAKVEQKAVEAEQEYKKLASTAKSLDKDTLKKAISDAKSKAKELRTKADKAAKNAKKAGEQVKKEEDSLKAAKRSDSRTNRGQKVENAKEYAKQAEEEAAKANELATKAEQEYKQLSGTDIRGTAATATEDTGKAAKVSAAPKKAPTPATDISKAATEVASKDARATAAKAVESKAKDATATASKGLGKDLSTAAKVEKDTAKAVESGAKVLKAGEEIASKAGKVRFVVEYGFKGARLLGKIGKFVFTFMEVSGLNLLGDILLVIDAIDFVVDLINRKKNEEKKEWARIVDFLYGEPKTIKSVFGVPYYTSIRDSILSILQFKLSDPSYSRNYLFWLNKWNKEPAWEGFVYTEVNFLVQRQERQQTDNDEPYNTKYYWGDKSEIELVDVPKDDQYSRTVLGIVSESSEDNFSSKGTPAPYADPKYNYVVERSIQDILYTQPIPCLTPFDFIIVKCRILYSAIISYISKYDNFVMNGLEDVVDEKFVDQYLHQDLFEGFVFPKWLNGDKIRFCVTAIFQAIKYLSQHYQQTNDYGLDKNNVKYNKGFYRRQQLLYNLVTGKSQYNGKRLFVEVSIHLLNLVNGDRNSNLIKPVDPELTTLTDEYLSDLATEIDKDIQRAFNDTKKRPYAYMYQGVEKKTTP